MILGLVSLLLLAVLFVVLTIAIVAGRHRGARPVLTVIGLVLAAVVFLVVASSYFWLSHSVPPYEVSSHQVRMPDRYSSYPAEAAVVVGDAEEHAPSAIEVVDAGGPYDATLGYRPAAGAAWLPEVEEEFLADLYPSVDSAARALGRKMAPLIVKVLPVSDGGTTKPGTDDSNDALQEPSNSDRAVVADKQQPQPSMIQLHGARLDEPGYEQVLNDIAEVLRGTYPDAQVLVESMPTADPITKLDDASVSVVISKRMHHTRPEETKGEFNARLSASNARVINTSVKFVDKPWVSSFDEYLSLNPTQNDFLALSRSFTSTADDARNQAQQAAVDRLSTMVDQRAFAWDDAISHGVHPHVRQELLARLKSGSLVRDQFSQRLHTDEGDVWRHAILVSGDTGQLNTVVGLLERRRPPQHIVAPSESIRRVSRFGGLVGVFVCVCGVFWVLDSVTKGFYTWRIGVVLTTVAIIALGLLLTIT